MERRFFILIFLLLTACQRNQEIIQQSAHNLAAQSPHVTSIAVEKSSPWIPLLIGVGIPLILLVISLFLLWQRTVRKAVQEKEKASLEKQKATRKAREARLRAAYQNRLAQNTLPRPTQPPPQEPPHRW